jgi:hypothetical protein
MSKAPSFQFYPADWQRDLSEHPLEIEGAWIRICCALWWSETPGISTKPLTNWARVLRVGEKKSLSIITYLLNQKIAEVDIQNTTITIISRRMVHDEYIRNIRRCAGSKGGNPSLSGNKKDNDLDKQNLVNQKPTPSSSSSKNTPIVPNGDFELFWKAYPRKMSKGAAKKAWLKLKPKPNEQLLATILAAIERAKTSVEWTKDGGEFIPYPATWLRAEGWNDEFKIPDYAKRSF